MDNVEKLKQIGILGDVRQRLGAENESDDSMDDKVNRLTNSQLVGAWSGWNLGDESWWTDMKRYFYKLESLDNGK